MKTTSSGKSLITLLSMASVAFCYSSEKLRASEPITSSKSLSPPNIVLVMADDLGFSDIGCYGGEVETPVLDSLASNGLRFTQFYNAARCWPTRSSVLTGYYPQQVNNHVHGLPFPQWGHLIPHHLKQAGYRCYHSGKWHIPNVATQTKQGGFDRAYSYNGFNTHFLPALHYLDDEELPPVTDHGTYYATINITDYAIGFLKEHQELHADAPFFLYLAHYAPHFPLHALQEDIAKYRERYITGWEALKMERYERQKKLGFDFGMNSPFEYFVTAPWSWPEKWLSDSIPNEMRMAMPWGQLTKGQQEHHATKMAIHAAMVDRIDKELGRLLTQIKAMDADQNTLVLFVSDNGATSEQIIRGAGHDRNALPGSADSYLCLGPGFSTASNTPFRRHKSWTHEGGIATPMIAYWPQGIKDKGDFRHSMAHVIDFLPTFLDVAGVDALTGGNGYEAPTLPGNSLLPVFEDDQQIHDELYFSHQDNFALRQGKWKAVISSKVDGRWQLYNMEDDRTELHNLADDFHNFGNQSWRQFHRDLLETMKTRWEALDEMYRSQGKAGIE